ncbi:MAG: DUF4864 domain-containing protein [Verrucomicrobia bacterium]|nr:DUF4864 domain-containing protein [Verrucomicrobiota bacterium]
MLHPPLVGSANLFQVHLVRISLFLITAWVSDVSLGQLADLTPRPELSPEQVVGYQVTALQHNDEPQSDAGIERAFRFASPANKQMTGPLEKFVRIVKSPVYSPMLNNRSSLIVGSQVQDDQAKIAVKVVAADGRQVIYLFALSKQADGEFVNCWMTDAVAPLEDDENNSGQGVTI